MFDITIDPSKHTNASCGKDCPVFLKRWEPWLQTHHRAQLALVDVRSPNRYFDKVLDAKSRNMIRKCERRGFTFNTFTFNSYLNDIYKINTSKAVRQGKPMTEGYTKPPRPISRKEELCDLHQHVWIGGFKDNRLLAYCNLIVLGEIAIINQILGHDKSLTYGIMNGLVNKLVWVSYRSGAKFLNYLDLDNCTESMARFKRSVGFKSYQVFFV